MSRPTGIIHLIHRAPLDMTYQHQIDFKSPSEQMTYWGSKTKYTLREYSYIRRERRSIKVDKPFDDLEGINYLAYQARSDSGTKWYYCFVTDKEYINDESTRLYFDIDVFQTFMFDYTFKPSYITQAHVDRWDANHEPIYSRTEEGLNYGTEYVTECAYKMGVGSEDSIPHGFYLIYLASVKNTEELNFGSWGEGSGLSNTTIWGNPIPYLILCIPHLTNPAQSEIVFGYPTSDGGVSSISSMHEFQDFMGSTALGNYVKQIVYTPYLPFKYKMATVSGNEEGVQLGFEITGAGAYATKMSITAGTKTLHAIVIGHIENDSDYYKEYASMAKLSGLEDKIPSEDMWSALKTNPKKTERDRRFESKLLCFPYRYNLFTDWVSTPCLVKNEYIGSDKITIKGSVGLGFNTPRRYWIDGYRGDPEGREVSVSQLLPLEHPVLTDAYYTYMLQNRNQISANVTNAKINATVGVVSQTVKGAINGAGAGGGYGAVFGAVGGLLQSTTDSLVNIEAMLRSENAKQSDIKNMPDTISVSNDTTLALADKCTYLTFYRKAICCEFEEQLAQYWHMYGYKVNRMDVPNLRSRVRYNFIKTIGANIEGAMENNYLATLKAIYDKGVTIWHYSAEDFYPLDYTYENAEVSLL